MPEAALAVDSLSHSFGGRKALDDVSLSLAKGEFAALVGLNGAGKSTLFSLITRLYDNTSGSIRVLGADIRRRPTDALRQLGVVFQSRTLDQDLTVEQNMFYFAALQGMSRRVAKERMMAELERIGLSDRLRDKVRTLSGGQIRRVEIARVQLHRPKLLLLDEPTVGLDPGARKGIVEYVHDLAEKQGVAVLWATHLFDEVAARDQVFVLHEGKILGAGTADELARRTGTTDLASAFNQLTDVRRPAA